MMKVYYPPLMDPSKEYPCMLFYTGGPWKKGEFRQFEFHARYFAEREIICFLVEYGGNNTQEFSFSECISDAKSSIRFIREHAEMLHVDVEKIVAAGASAGGHLASSLAFIKGHDDPEDNRLIDHKPNALVLFNPVIDLGPASPIFYEKATEQYKDLSPIYNIKANAPPTIILIGTEDQFIPVEMVQYYKLVMDAVGSRCDLLLYEGERHGFFNIRNEEFFRETVFQVDKFLISLAYLKGEPSIRTFNFNK
jgi:acetyl esterase/lipase